MGNCSWCFTVSKISTCSGGLCPDLILLSYIKMLFVFLSKITHLSFFLRPLLMHDFMCLVGHLVADAWLKTHQALQVFHLSNYIMTWCDSLIFKRHSLYCCQQVWYGMIILVVFYFAAGGYWFTCFASSVCVLWVLMTLQISIFGKLPLHPLRDQSRTSII